MSTANQYKGIFQAILNRDQWWSRISGSQFATLISTFVGQMVFKAEQACGRYLQEAFLSTAVKRASILAAAEDKGYIGRRRAPSIGSVTVVNLSSKPRSVPVNSPLLSAVDVSYVITQAAEIPAGGSLVLPVAQLYLRKFTTTVETADKFIEVLLPKEVSAEAHRVDVFVTGASGAAIQWEKRYMFRRTTSTDTVYAEFYKPTEQLGIRFGNGINGKIPDVGAVITLNVWTTLGDTTLIDGQSLDFVDGAEHLNEFLTVTTASSVVGGSEAESDEETRAAALYVTPFDSQIVWDDDYGHFIRTNIPNVIWSNAWGEQEQEEQDGAPSLDNINVVYVSAYSARQDQNALGAQIVELLVSTKNLNKTYRYVPVNYRPFTVTVTGTATGEKDLVAVEQVIRETLELLYGIAPETARPEILERAANRTIQDLNLLHDFSLSWDNFPTDLQLADYVYMDVENSAIQLSYLES